MTVFNLFNRIASSYDLMNDVMSLGTHRLWKTTFINNLPWDAWKNMQSNPDSNPAPNPVQETPIQFLDMACGTGDIGYGVMEKAVLLGCTLNGWMIDPCPNMLRQARQAHPQSAFAAQLSWVQAYAENIPLPDACCHGYLTSFGLRNMRDRTASLAEAFRVLKPSGILRILEFSRQAHPLVNWGYQPYRRRILPLLGQWIAKDRDAYDYLSQSIEAFPSPATICAELTQAGFCDVEHQAGFAGLITFYKGEKKC
jgi:demethylmenaquinone methyltransferase/2-methoxy-6-polyprenyl-1,4-benzoquinol methylase